MDVSEQSRFEKALASAGLSHMSGLMSVIPAKAGIQWPNQAVCIRKFGIPHILDSGFRRSDGVAIHMR